LPIKSAIPLQRLINQNNISKFLGDNELSRLVSGRKVALKKEPNGSPEILKFSGKGLGKLLFQKKFPQKIFSFLYPILF